MKAFISALKEINFSLNKIFIFNTALNTTITFLASYLLLSLLNINKTIALLPAAAYLMAELSKKAKENKILDVEAKYDTLKEKLRTAADNAYLENQVTNTLKTEVMKELHNVEEATFFNEKEAFTKSAAIMVLCLLIILLAPIHIKGINLNIITDQISNIQFTTQQGNEQPTYTIGGPAGAGTAPNQEIFGKKTVAKLGTEELKVKINPIGYELNVRNVQEPEQKDFNEQYPNEVFTQGAEAYEENIPKDQQIIVKNYFQKRTEG